MNIALAGVISKPITEVPLGGTEAFTFLLVKGLVEQGNHVTLFCAKGSQTAAQNHIFIADSKFVRSEISNVQLVYPYTLLEVRAIQQELRKNRYDILHINFLKTFIASFIANSIDIPILHTIHRDFFQHKELVEVYKKIGIHTNEHFAFVSKNALSQSLIKEHTHIIHNGIDIDLYPMASSVAQHSYVWLSRIDPLKGPDVAIQAAKLADVEIVLCGDIDRNKYQKYFEESIQKHIDERRTYISAVHYKEKVELYQSAKAFIFPIQWEEPFGLVLIEALSTGTPVISFRRGAIPEIIQDGYNGFVVDPKLGADGIAQAIKKIEKMNPETYSKLRKNSRSSAEKFNYLEMTKKYETLYSQLITAG